ncbi:MAG: amino acid-binding protein [Alphaproteobacteria bacterium]|jgi:glycine cleavage system transcriptional repressor
MSQRAIVSISCVSQSGLLSAVSERLFELGCNLADTTYALLAGSAEFTTVCELPGGMAEETLALELHRTPVLAGARIVVGPFDEAASEARSQRITHRFEISGPDQPGKIKRLSAAFAACGAEVVRLNSQKSVTDGVAVSTIRIAVSLPDGADTAPVTEATDALGLSCRVEDA